MDKITNSEAIQYLSDCKGCYLKNDKGECLDLKCFLSHELAISLLEDNHPDDHDLHF